MRKVGAVGQVRWIPAVFCPRKFVLYQGCPGPMTGSARPLLFKDGRWRFSIPVESYSSCNDAVSGSTYSDADTA
jgi:hypothetical protein